MCFGVDADMSGTVMVQYRKLRIKKGHAHCVCFLWLVRVLENNMPIFSLALQGCKRKCWGWSCWHWKMGQHCQGKCWCCLWCKGWRSSTHRPPRLPLVMWCSSCTGLPASRWAFVCHLLQLVAFFLHVNAFFPWTHCFEWVRIFENVYDFKHIKENKKGC